MYVAEAEYRVHPHPRQQRVDHGIVEGRKVRRYDPRTSFAEADPQQRYGGINTNKHAKATANNNN